MNVLTFGSIDVIVYIGDNDFKVKNLIKTPKMYEPKKYIHVWRNIKYCKC